MISYMIQSSVALALAYLLYELILKKEKSFVFNRFYLLGTVLICLIAPALEFHTDLVIPTISEITVPNLLAANLPVDEEITGLTVENIEKETAIFPQLLLFLYILITIGFVARFSRNLLKLKALSSGNKINLGRLRVVLVPEETNPFSFFNCVFINEKAFVHEKYTESMIKHEEVHSKQLHSADIIMIELVTCFFWFNPFIWFYKKAIAENHEYIADNAVTKDSVTVEEYSTRIVQSLKTCYPINLTSGFSYVQTKNRLIMLNKKKSSLALRVIKFSCVALLLGASLLFSSFDGKSDKTPFVVVVDAGHGGKDNGAKFGELLEKDLVLKISKKLKTLSENNGIKVVLTRETDEFVTFDDRLKYADEQKANLLLSIHFNFSVHSENNGVEAYYQKEGEFQSQSYNYSKILVTEQLKTVNNKGEIKTAGYFILKKANCPGVLLNLGFLSNSSDRQKLAEPEYLNQLATSLYNGLIEIKEQAL